MVILPVFGNGGTETVAKPATSEKKAEKTEIGLLAILL